MWTSQVLGIITSNGVAENLFQIQFTCVEPFNFKNPILMIIVVNASVLMIGCWQVVATYFYLLLLCCSRTSQRVCRASVCEMKVLSSPNIWCHRHFMMGKITCSGLGNGNMFHSILSTVSLFPIHQRRYLILRHSQAIFHPFHTSYKNTCLWSNMCVLV